MESQIEEPFDGKRVEAVVNEAWRMTQQSSKFTVCLMDWTCKGIPSTTEGIIVCTFWENQNVGSATQLPHWVEQYLLSHYGHQGPGYKLYCATEFGQVRFGINKIVAAPLY